MNIIDVYDDGILSEEQLEEANLENADFPCKVIYEVDDIIEEQYMDLEYDLNKNTEEELKQEIIEKLSTVDNIDIIKLPNDCTVFRYYNKTINDLSEQLFDKLNAIANYMALSLNLNHIKTDNKDIVVLDFGNYEYLTEKDYIKTNEVLTKQLEEKIIPAMLKI
jgi:hypothetical protein